jgi:hypothetical protein
VMRGAGFVVFIWYVSFVSAVTQSVPQSFAQSFACSLA